MRNFSNSTLKDKENKLIEKGLLKIENLESITFKDVENFINDKIVTINVKTGEKDNIRRHARSRSIFSLYRLLKYYIPNLEYKTVYNTIANIRKHEPFGYSKAWYCPDIQRYVIHNVIITQSNMFIKFINKLLKDNK